MQDDRLTPDCARFQHELASLLYEELAGDARAVLEQHLAGCVACRDELASLRDTRLLLTRWETPPAHEDPRQLARAIAAAAGARTPPRARRGRLLRWSALLSGAAAALLFTLSLLQAEVSLEHGRFQLSFGLPGARPAEQVPGSAWRDEVRAIAAQELAVRAASLEQSQEELYQRCSLMTQQEMLRLSQAVDYARAQDQESWDALIENLGRKTVRADLETRRALTQLASYLPPPTNR